MLNIPQCHFAKDKRAEVMFLCAVKVTVILSLLNLQVMNRNHPKNMFFFTWKQTLSHSDGAVVGILSHSWNQDGVNLTISANMCS